MLCALLAWPACYEADPVPDHLQTPRILGAVWAADGDNFYISTRSRVIRWENGAPVEVTYEGGSVTALGGTEAGLVALLESGIVQFDGSSWQVTLQPPGNWLFELTVTPDAIYAMSLSSTVVDARDFRSTIYRYDGVDWEVDFESGPFTSLLQVRGRPDTGLWAIGNQTHEASDLDASYATPVLLRRGAGGWESMDSTHFGSYLVQSRQCEGEVCALLHLWVDLEGRAHVAHAGQGIFVHDGMQSWIEDSPIGATHRFSRLEASRDGTVYAIAASLWGHDGSGWQSTLRGSDFHPRGLSAFDGGAIITGCATQGSEVCKVGRVLRAWPDGTVQEIRSVPLTGSTLW